MNLSTSEKFSENFEKLNQLTIITKNWRPGQGEQKNNHCYECIKLYEKIFLNTLHKLFTYVLHEITID